MMKNGNVNLFKNLDTFLKIELPCDKNEICFCNEINIFFQNQNKQFLLYRDCILHTIRILNLFFKETLNNQLQLHSSLIKDDLGYLWNKYLNEDEINSQEFVEIDERWIGRNYLIYKTRNIATWLYQKNDKIYLEITPVYSWHFSDSQPGENYITYEEFMKNYKPLEIIELDKETIKKWLAQTEELLEIMNSNEEKAEKEYEAKQQKAS